MKSVLIVFWDSYFGNRLHKKNGGVSIHTDPQQIEDTKNQYYTHAPRKDAPWRDSHVEWVYVTDDTFERTVLTENGLFCLRDSAPVEIEFPPE